MFWTTVIDQHYGNGRDAVEEVIRLRVEQSRSEIHMKIIILLTPVPIIDIFYASKPSKPSGGHFVLELVV